MFSRLHGAYEILDCLVFRGFIIFSNLRLLGYKEFLLFSNLGDVTILLFLFLNLGDVTILFLGWGTGWQYLLTFKLGDLGEMGNKNL